MNRKHLQGYRELFNGNVINLALSILASLLSALSRLSVAWILQSAILCVAQNDASAIPTIILVSVISYAGMALSMWLTYRFAPTFYLKGAGNYRQYVFSRIFKKNAGNFFTENTATYVSLLTNDANSIERNYLEHLPDLVELVVTFVGALILMVVNNAFLAAIAISFSLIPFFFSFVAGKGIPAIEKKLAETNSSYVEKIKDTLSGFSVIKSFKAENAVLTNHRENNDFLVKTGIERDRAHIYVESVSHFLGNLNQLMIFILCAVLAVNGYKNVNAGTAVFFIQLMNYVIGPIQQIPPLMMKRKAAFALMDKHEELLSANQNRDRTIALNETDNEITVKNLSLSFGIAERDALENINCRFKSGSCTVIVGESGSGKSTLLNILSGLNRDYRGEVLYGDKSLESVPNDSLYDVLSLIQQNIYIFNDTIRNNITMFSNASDQEVNQAVALSGLSSVLESKGPDYVCGENGNQLSGGEKQRIAIARTVLKKQQILLFDEVTSALDPQTAYQINQTILSLQGITRIVVMHTMDRNMLAKCDSILAMKNGCIIESGSFNELMEKKGYFYSLLTISGDDGSYSTN